MLKLLVASRNAGKLREFSELLPGLHLVSWPAKAPEIPEDGAFFHDNAIQKAEFAMAWWKAHGQEPVDGALADDSGLCVDALWGGPGVLSARFARGLPQSEKNLKLLAMLPEGANRNARFVCVLALAHMDGSTFTVSGSVPGVLAHEPRGSNGFGFDPIFIPDTYRETFGELPREVKHRLSHRARACGALLERLASDNR